MPETEIEHIMAPALLAVHNNQRTGGRLVFVERSYLVPTEILGQVQDLMADYEVGRAHQIYVEG